MNARNININKGHNNVKLVEGLVTMQHNAEAEVNQEIDQCVTSATKPDTYRGIVMHINDNRMEIHHKGKYGLTIHLIQETTKISGIGLMGTSF